MFEAGHAALMAYASGDKTVEETRSELQSILDRTDIPIPLRDRLEGQEWAMKNPLCRDIFLGVQENHERWSRGEVDAHLPAGVV
jgi:hypothetical protein